jgi:predicted O-methyltransferase YrrM
MRGSRWPGQDTQRTRARPLATRLALPRRCGYRRRPYIDTGAGEARQALELPIDIDSVKGFLSHAEGKALHRYAAGLEGAAPAVEIGSYCGRSSVYLGLGCRASSRALLAVDHHRGSEEHQAGELFHDPDLVDDDGLFSTIGEFRRTLRRAKLEDTVIPVLADSAAFAALWQVPVSLLFIDGGHSLDTALEDYRAWSGRIERGGILAIHDVYPGPEAGGQAPITVYRLARASGLFEDLERVDSLRVLRRR